MTIFGRRDTWAIEIDPMAGPPSEPDPASAATWAAIRIWADGRNLSAHTRTDSLVAVEALHWPAAFLARWFLQSWGDFWERAGWPLPGAVVDAEKACARLDAYLAQSDPDEEFLDRRDAFVASHSLLAAAGGSVMPYVYLLREGATVHVVWNDLSPSDASVRFHQPQGHCRIPAGEFVEAIAGFMRWCQDLTVTAAPMLAKDIDAWLSRVHAPASAEAVLQGYVRPWGVPSGRAALDDLDVLLDLPKNWRSAGALVDPNRFAAAVVFRALSPVLDDTDVATLLGRLRACPVNVAAAAKLEIFRTGIEIPSRDLPHQQGYALAERVRERLGNRDHLLDIDALLTSFGIEVRKEDLSDDSVDAATVWDDQHGPVIIVNELGHRNVPWAQRMTLAHELCHLLVDRHQAAPLMIASTPWAPPELERRANAFAAELLLPREGINRCIGAELHSSLVGDAARQCLMSEFQVGETVCRHQLENRLRICE